MSIFHNSLRFFRLFTLTGAGLTAALISCQAALAQSAAGTSANTVGMGARFIESCRQALERQVVQPGCQETLRPNELAQLKEDALRSNNPDLLTLVGDAYKSNRGGIADLGQAYRWYLLAAVRGDPRAMQRLSDMYRSGQGVPNDNVKALGYARLAQTLASPGTSVARQATSAVGVLGRLMAADERALAEQFAADLAHELRQQAGSASEKGASSPEPKDTSPTTSQLPGLDAVNVSPPPSDASPAQDAAPSARSMPAPLLLPGSTQGANSSNP